ncbi:hypothetical protein BH09BAC4_BH09BAC4_40110 [soil metagenome]
MEEKNKAILEAGNAAIAAGNNEGFLSLCSEDTEWTFVGDKTLRGKEAVRQWMATEYVEPPTNTVVRFLAEGDFLTVLGYLVMKDKDGRAAHYEYCDIWRFQEGQIVELKAFVIKTDTR